MANVLNYIFSHAQVTKKNLLVTMLIVSLFYTPCHHIIECFCYCMVYSSDYLICDYLSSKKLDLNCTMFLMLLPNITTDQHVPENFLQNDLNLGPNGDAAVSDVGVLQVLCGFLG